MAADGIDEIVRDVDDVARAGGSLEFERLKARVVGMREIQAGERCGLPDREGVERALRRVADFTGETACGRGLKIGHVSDAVGSISNGARPVRGIKRKIHDSGRRVGNLGCVASEVKDVRCGLGDAARGPLVFVNAAEVGTVDLEGPSFGTGGVAANSQLRATFEERARSAGLDALFPSRALSTDNAAMIAAAAYPRFCAGVFADASLNADPSLALA
jgi:hypothetical protein